jgi:hypothetical protein
MMKHDCGLAGCDAVWSCGRMLTVLTVDQNVLPLCQSANVSILDVQPPPILIKPLRQQGRGVKMELQSFESNIF